MQRSFRGQRKKIQTIRYLFDHKDIKTTMRYLGIPDLNSPETRKAVEETSKEFKAAQIDTAPITTAAVRDPCAWDSDSAMTRIATGVPL